MVKGSEMILECQVSGSAPFTLSFYKNSKVIRNDRRHRITVKENLLALQILAVEAGDVGLYQCAVENEVGRSSCECQVTLKGWFHVAVFTPVIKECFDLISAFIYSWKLEHNSIFI